MTKDFSFVREVIPAEYDVTVARGRDGLVHVLRRDVVAFDVYPDKTPVGDGFIAYFVCGERCKLGWSRRNHLTEEPATCIVCLVGGYPCTPKT